MFRNYFSASCAALQKIREEIDKDNLILLKEYSIKYKVLFSNRKNFDLLKKKYSSIYYGLPCSKLNFPKNTNYNKEKNVGIILRPFIKRFNSKSLQRYDYYISSYEDNIFFLNIAKELNNKGYNIFLDFILQLILRFLKIIMEIS